MVRNSPENKLSWVAGSIETKAISASNLKLKLTEAELGKKDLIHKNRDMKANKWKVELFSTPLNKSIIQHTITRLLALPICLFADALVVSKLSL